MSKLLASIGAILALLNVFGLWPCLAEKSYSVELNSFQPVNGYDNTWVDWDTLRLKKVARNKFSLTGDFIIKLNMGDEQKISLQVFRYNANTKSKGLLILNINKPLCKFIKEDKDTYPNMLKASNLPEQGLCPFPKGQYSFDNYMADTSFLPDSTPKGDYLVVLQILDKNTIVAALEAHVTLVK